MRITNFYGTYFIRGTDLLALPNCHADSTFGVELGYEDTVVSASVISVQAALLYTTSSGERRIRVHTIAAPVTTVFANMFLAADVDTVCNMMAKQALAQAQKTGLDSARDFMYRRLVDVMRSYKSTQGRGMYGAQQQQPQGLGLPEQLQLLPLYTMALQKNKTFRGGQDIRSDERAYLFHQVKNMSVEDSRVFVYPRLFALHDMAAECGLPVPDDGAGGSGDDDSEVVTAGSQKIRLPNVVNLSYDRLQKDGVFLLEDSQALYMWVGQAVSPAFLQSVFSIQSLQGIDCSQLVLLQNPDDLSQRVNNIVSALREERSTFMQLNVVSEGDPYEPRFCWHLVGYGIAIWYGTAGMRCGVEIMLYCTAGIWCWYCVIGIKRYGIAGIKMALESYGIATWNC
jgi:protein transport protein SEC24